MALIGFLPALVASPQIFLVGAALLYPGFEGHAAEIEALERWWRENRDTLSVTC